MPLRHTIAKENQLQPEQIDGSRYFGVGFYLLEGLLGLRRAVYVADDEYAAGLHFGQQGFKAGVKLVRVVVVDKNKVERLEFGGRVLERTVGF